MFVNVKFMHKFLDNRILITSFIVLLNIVLKGLYLSANSIGGDEPFSIYHAQMDMFSIIEQLSKGNNPPLYELLLHLWIKVFGISEFSVRIPSLLFNSVAVLFVFKIGENHFSRNIAIIASLLFVFSNYQVLYAHEARVYALMGMLSVVSMYYYLELISIKNNRKLKFVVFILANTLLLYSHYFGFFVLFVQLLHSVIHKDIRNKYWKYIFISTTIIGVLYIPNIIILFDRFLDSSTNGTWVKAPSGITDIYNMLRRFTNAPVVTVFSAILLIGFLIKGVIKKNNFKNNYANNLVYLWFIFTFFFMFIVSYKIPMFIDRYLMFVNIGFYFLLAIAVVKLFTKRLPRNIMSFLVIVLFVITFKPNISNKRDVKETISKIKELKGENTVVLFCPKHFVLNYAYYQDVNIFQDVNTKDIYKNINKDLKKINIIGVDNINDVDIQEWEHIIYLDAAANFSHPDNDILKTLELDYTIDSKYEYYSIFNIYEYKRK